jgi:hypothetical protein
MMFAVVVTYRPFERAGRFAPLEASDDFSDRWDIPTDEWRLLGLMG